VALLVLLLAVTTVLVGSPLGRIAHADPAPPATPAFGPWIDAPASYEAPTQCLTTVQPGVQLLQELLTTTYGRTSFGTLRACSGGVATSEHNEGRALDFMLSVSNPADAAVARSFLGWLLATDADGHPFANARRLGVMYVIWDKQMWRAYDPVWKPYTGASEHTDHIHISVSWEGARLETSFWRPDLSTSCDPAVVDCSLATADVDVYTTPGYHSSGGRLWLTRCEAYGAATRCWTYIRGTKVVATSSGYTSTTGWVFNNLTYVDQWRTSWDANMLAVAGLHDSAGRQWKVTCTPDVTTGPRTCKAWIWATVVSRTATSTGFVYRTYATWRFNDQVRLTAPPAS
jgi:hypothetical protein